jgi:serine/threonine protein kinase
MPAPANLDAFVELLGKSALVEAERLRLFLQQDGPLSTTPRKLAARLVAAGLLTQFQAEQLLLGKHRGFTLGKYRILERIGSGGHSTVYLGEHLIVKRRVAIKVLPAARSESPAGLARFYREARASGAIDHPNMVKAHDVDQDNGLHFLIMDYVDGSSLQEMVSRFGPLSPGRSAHYIRQAAQGLQAAHAAGLVHRDIKPANILLDRHGVIRVLDLGLARFFCDSEDPLTLKYDNNNVLGTADYVAPEQALNSHEVDARADIYSLGATFYFLLAGRPLFPEGKVTHKLMWHQTRQPTPLRQLRPETPPELAAIVERMIEKEPQRRYRALSEVIEVLTPWTTTPLPPPSEEEMPRLSPAVRAARIADADLEATSTPRRRSGVSGSAAALIRLMNPASSRHSQPPQRPRTMAEIPTPTFLGEHIDTPTGTLPSLVPPVIERSVPSPPASPTPGPATTVRERQGARELLKKRILSSTLLLLLGVFTGTGLRMATNRIAPEAAQSDAGQTMKTRGVINPPPEQPKAKRPQD